MLSRKTSRGKSENQPAALGIDQVFGLGRRLEELDEKAEWCSRIASDLKGSSTSDYIVSALEYYRHERESLLGTPSLTYPAIKSALEWCSRGGKDEQSREDPGVSRLKAGLMIVESGLLQQEPQDGGNKTTTIMAADLKETSRRVTAKRLERLLVEFLKSRKGVLACPQCKSRKTHYREYTVVFDSSAMECESCGRLWKVVN